MKTNNNTVVSAIIVALGLALIGYFIKTGMVEFRAMERSVEVKGLSEREVLADTVIWPIQFSAAGNDLSQLMQEVDNKNQAVVAFLTLHGFDPKTLNINPPDISDKLANAYNSNDVKLRYSVTSSLTVFSDEPEKVQNAMAQISTLAKQGIAIMGQNYGNRVEYLFTGLNSIKPQMIEEATKKAREVAVKFATDSDSKLGKIKTARQGQFSINNRDSNTPHIKRVRVVATVEYYLSD